MEVLKRRGLGDTGLEPSELTLGTWGLCGEAYGRVFAEQEAATLARALERGITSFDMAPTWGADGEAERAVARAVGTRRGELIYITRAGRVPGEGGLVPAFSPAELGAQCEASLRRLGSDYIDVLLLQHPNVDVLRRDELRACLENLVRAGKVRAWGASVSHADDARAAIVVGARVLCVPFNLLQPDLVWDVASECKERGIGVLARSVQLHGLLGGRWSEKKRFAPDDHRMQRWSPEALGARLRQARDFRQRLNAEASSMTALALKFVLAHDEIASATFGPRTPAQVNGALDALDDELPLSVSDLQFIYNSIR